MKNWLRFANSLIRITQIEMVMLQENSVVVDHLLFDHQMSSKEVFEDKKTAEHRFNDITIFLGHTE